MKYTHWPLTFGALCLGIIVASSFHVISSTSAQQSGQGSSLLTVTPTLEQELKLEPVHSAAPAQMPADGLNEVFFLALGILIVGFVGAGYVALQKKKTRNFDHMGGVA